MKTAILKLFSWATLLEFIAKLRLGALAWDIVRKAVTEVEADMPEADGSFKLIAAKDKIFAMLKKFGIEKSKSLLNWGIESAVAMLKK